MTRAEQLHSEISSLFCGEVVGDCLDALCRSFATCLIVAARDHNQTDDAIVEMAARISAYVEIACRVLQEEKSCGMAQ